jgi:hypothetical protein
MKTRPDNNKYLDSSGQVNRRRPVDPSSNDFMQQLKTNQAYADSLIAKDESALRRRYGITEDEYDKIIIEGVKNSWPRPPSQP